MREAMCFSVVLKSIWVGEYNTINQHNCEKNGTTAKQNVQLQKNGTTAKLYVGIIQDISTTAKNGTTAKQNVQLQKKSITAKHIYCSCTFFGNT